MSMPQPVSSSSIPKICLLLSDVENVLLPSRLGSKIFCCRRSTPGVLVDLPNKLACKSKNVR